MGERASLFSTTDTDKLFFLVKAIFFILSSIILTLQLERIELLRFKVLRLRNYAEKLNVT